MSGAYDEALVEELARLHYVACETWDLPNGTTEPPPMEEMDRVAIRAVLDRLAELGRLMPPVCGATWAAVDDHCLRPPGHEGAHQSLVHTWPHLSEGKTP